MKLFNIVINESDYVPIKNEKKQSLLLKKNDYPEISQDDYLHFNIVETMFIDGQLITKESKRQDDILYKISYIDAFENFKEDSDFYNELKTEYVLVSFYKTVLVDSKKYKVGG